MRGNLSVNPSSPLGYYRCQAWLAWHHGLTGMGFWSYCTSEDSPWFPPALRHEYLLVYPGAGVVSSKRWEAVRDGIENYGLLTALKQAIDKNGASAQPEDVKAAKQLLGERAAVIAGFSGRDYWAGPGKGGWPKMRLVEDKSWAELQSVRRDLARLLDALGKPWNPGVICQDS